LPFRQRGEEQCVVRTVFFRFCKVDLEWIEPLPFPQVRLPHSVDILEATLLTPHYLPPYLPPLLVTLDLVSVASIEAPARLIFLVLRIKLWASAPVSHLLVVVSNIPSFYPTPKSVASCQTNFRFRSPLTPFSRLIRTMCIRREVHPSFLCFHIGIQMQQTDREAFFGHTLDALKRHF